MRHQALAVLFVWCLPAFAEEPYAFQDLKLGMTLEGVKAARRGLNCRKHTDSPIADVVCTAPTSPGTIADVQIRSLLAGFHENRLTSILILFDTDRFRTVTNELEKKHGKPISNKRTTDNIIMVWKNADGQAIQATQHFSGRSESAMQIFSADWKQRYDRGMAK